MSAIMLPRRENQFAEPLKEISSTLLNKFLLDAKLKQARDQIMAARVQESQSQNVLGQVLGTSLEEFTQDKIIEPGSTLENLMSKLDIQSKMLKKIPEGMPIDKNLFENIFKDVPTGEAKKVEGLTLPQELAMIDKDARDQRETKLGKWQQLLMDAVISAPLEREAIAAGMPPERVRKINEEILEDQYKRRELAFKKRGLKMPEFLKQNIVEASENMGELSAKDLTETDDLTEKERILLRNLELIKGIK